jgi:sigma-E factor negative regulatory protein RseA
MNMNTDLNGLALDARADISALADGRLRGEDFARALDLLEADADARAAWHTYHVIGDVLRGVPVGDAGQDMQLVQALREKLAQEPGYGRPASAALASDAIKIVASYADNSPAVAQLGAKTPLLAQPQAANDARWKWAAGFASVVAVAALAWNMVGGLGDGPGAQLAAAPQSNPNVVVVSTPHGDVLRDARLVEMMAAHKQFGGTSALQMPSGFLRNATFETQQR